MFFLSRAPAHLAGKWSGRNYVEEQMSAPKFRRAWFLPPVLTRGRIIFAMSVAVITDVLQLLLGPLGWAFADEALDIGALVLTSRALGFHPLLLPTFVLEFIPAIDMLPTWTGCTATVVMLRRNSRPVAPPVQATVVAEPPGTTPSRPQNEPLLIGQGEPSADQSKSPPPI